MWSPYPVLSLLLLCSCCWAESDPIVRTKYGKVSSYLIKSVCQLQKLGLLAIAVVQQQRPVCSLPPGLSNQDCSPIIQL